MTITVRNFGAPLALTFALLAGACKSDTNKSSDSLAQDTTLNRDLQMANRDTTAQPTLNDVPAPATTPAPAAPAARPSTSRPTTSRPTTSRPSSSTPAPPPSRPSNVTASGNTESRGTGASTGGTVGTIAEGTTINLTSNQRVCTNTNKVGDTFTATIAEAVTGSNGVSIPAGATATVRVTQLKRSENVNDNVAVGLDVTSVTYGGHTYNIDANTVTAQVDKVRNQPKSKDAQKVLGGAAVGAVLGQVIGKDTKGTVIGAAAGAAAGTAAAAATANYEGCIPSGGNIQIKLTAPAQVKA